MAPCGPQIPVARIEGVCGIVVALDSPLAQEVLRARVLAQSKKLRHRGPDWTGCAVQPAPRGGFHAFAHERLAIIDPAGGAQPIRNETGQIVVAVNGEIYNHRTLKESLKGHTLRSRSDCEVLPHLYEEMGADFVQALDGVFAFVLADEASGTWIAARDPIGVVPLYWGKDRDGATWFASEMKSIQDVCETFDQFPPGHLCVNGTLRRYWNPSWREVMPEPGSADLGSIRDGLRTATQKRMMSDVPFGVLLSGGLDSSLVTSLAVREVQAQTADVDPAWGANVHSFSIGLPGSPDLARAQEAANFLGTRHHNFEYSVEEGIDALRDVIHHIETYDVTTIRASTPMYLMARRIKAIGVKMVLSGEGSDEIFGGYLYFHKAPNAREFFDETSRKLQALNYYDCLRANKSMSAWGVEARVPFLDKAFIDVVMGFSAELKMVRPEEGRVMEKHVLRAAFDDPDHPYLPESILWRQKEQFSDGVGYSWIDSLKALAQRRVTDKELAEAADRFPVNTPLNKEAYFYRAIFSELFPSQAAAKTVPGGKSIACSSETALKWDKAWENAADPSGRAIAVHTEAYDDQDKTEAPTETSVRA